MHVKEVLLRDIYLQKSLDKIVVLCKVQVISVCDHFSPSPFFHIFVKYLQNIYRSKYLQSNKYSTVIIFIYLHTDF